MVFLQHISHSRRAGAGRVENVAGLYGNKAGAQIQQCGFAAAGGTDNGRKFAGKKIEVDVCQSFGLAIFCVIGMGEISDR